MGLTIASRAKAVPKIKIAAAADIRIIFIGAILGCLPNQHLCSTRCFRRRAEMVKELSTKGSVWRDLPAKPRSQPPLSPPQNCERRPPPLRLPGYPLAL